MEQSELTLTEYWRIIRKRKWTIVFVFLLVTVSTSIFTKMQTPIYEAVLELRVEKQQPGSGTTTPVDPYSVYDPLTGALNLATEIRLITSLPVMKKVVERMEVLPAEPEARENAVHRYSLGYQGRIQVNQIRDTNILEIHAQSSDPRKAALMATAIADVYIVENVESRKKQSVATITYIDNQLVVYKKQLAEYEDQLQKFKQDEKVFEVTADVKATLDRLTVSGSFEFENEMLQIELNLKNLNELLERKIAEGTSADFSGKAVEENFIFIGLKRRLLELEFERFLLLIDYTEKHPAVLDKDKIIDGVKNKIVAMLKDYADFAITPEMEGDLALAIKKIFLETRREVLYRIINKFYEDEGSLSSNQVQYVGLKRNIDRLLNSYDELLKQKDEAKLNLAKVIDDVVTVVSPANTPDAPIRPVFAINFLVSCAAGLMLGMLACFLKESIDSSVSTISDVEQDLKLSILGIIPHIKKEDFLIDAEKYDKHADKQVLLNQAKIVTVSNPKSWPAESYKMLRSNIIQLMKTKNVKTILFTSSDRQEGKSTTIANIAISMAQMGKKTLLIGANMRRPTLYRTLGLSREPGLSDILMGNVKWKEALKTSTDLLIGGFDIDNLLQMPGIDNFHMITAGRPVDNVSELLNSKAFDVLLKELKNYFDIILIDCSPVMPVPDSVTLSDRVDGVVLIYMVGRTSKEILKRAKAHLVNARANLLGIVLNNLRTEAQVGYTGLTYTYYGEKPGGRETFGEKWKRQLKKEPKADEQKETTS
jgi:capsular exopolysaccharide synthesis family protein